MVIMAGADDVLATAAVVDDVPPSGGSNCGGGGGGCGGCGGSLRPNAGASENNTLLTGHAVMQLQQGIALYTGVFSLFSESQLWLHKSFSC
ncbi:hypothetical protein ACE6H2_014251 [Prunus campanulata]